MYRRCYRYEDMAPTAAVRMQRNPQIKPPERPAAVSSAAESQQNEAASKYISSLNEAGNAEACELPAQLHTAGQSEKENTESEFSAYTQGITSSMKGIYENIRRQLIRDGKVLGILETDDLILILLIVILIAEDCEDYVLILALAALIFLK